jgi:hypothetical protein
MFVFFKWTAEKHLTYVCICEISVSWRMKVTVFWDAALCSVAEIGQCFRDDLLPPLSSPDKSVNF